MERLITEEPSRLAWLKTRDRICLHHIGPFCLMQLFTYINCGRNCNQIAEGEKYVICSICFVCYYADIRVRLHQSSSDTD